MTVPQQRARLSVALAVAIIFITRFAVAAWYDPARDGDIGWQQWLGLQILHTGRLPHALGPEAFTAPGAPWVPQEWALSLAVAVLLGTPWFPALVFAATLACAIALAYTAFASRRLGASTIAVAIAVTCVACSMLGSFGIRAQVFGWAALAAVMYLLRCAPGRAKWWIVPITVLWANLHASAMLSPVLTGLWCAGSLIEQRAWTGIVREYALLAVACAAAVFATPLGYHLPLYAVTLLQSPIRAHISEWQAPNLTEVPFTLGALALILLRCWLGFGDERRWREALVFTCTAFMALGAARNVPLCAIVIAPAVAQRLGARLPEHLRVNAIFSERPVMTLLGIGTLAGVLLSGAALAASPEFKRGNLPRAAIETLAAMPGTHRVYCEDFAWCSLALAHRNLREFIDGRCDPFPLAVWRDYVAIYRAKGAWRHILDARRVDALIVKKRGPLARALPSVPGWRLAYADRTYRLFVRDGVRSTAYRR